MLNQSKVTITSGSTRKIILVDTANFQSISVVVGNAGIAADANGKKILKAGMPLKGNLEARNTAFAITALDTDVVGIAMHDVDVTSGDANGAILLTGMVDVSKLESDVQTALTATIKVALPTIKFVK